MILNFPPLDCSLLFPDLINFHMERNPSFPAFVYINESAPDTLTEISFLEFSRAAHRVAHTLRPSRQGSDGEVVMLIANTDTILHHAVFAGLSLAGWVPFPVSPRNSAAAVVNMMNKTNCSRIVTLEHAHRRLIDAIHQEINGTQPTVYKLPTLRYAFPRLGHEVAADTFVPYPPPSKCPDLDSPVLYFHSSGSTGFPKPIAHTHRLQIQWFTRAYMRQCAELPSPRRIAAMVLPALHAFGIFIGLYAPIVSLVTTVVYPPRTDNSPRAQPVIPTSDNMIEVLKKVGWNVLMTVPAFLEQVIMSEEAIKTLKKIDSVVFGGGPLPVNAGDKLWAAGVQLASAYGGTEFGGPVIITRKDDIADGDWMWMRFLDDLELSVGRADDVITLASGEKTVPAPMESIIGSSPLVQGVIMFGRERNQVDILIEPRPEHAIDVSDEKAVADFRNRIWPVIEEAKKLSPAFSRIFKEMILITSDDKPVSRASKGTVQRKATLYSYKAEVDALYDLVEASSLSPNGLAGPSVWTTEVVEGWLLKHARVINPNCEIDPHSDLFAQGFDSLSAMYLRNKILGALPKSSDATIKDAAVHIPPIVVFENPTIHQLSSRIASLVNKNGPRQVVDHIEQHKEAINAMIEKYSVGLDGPADGGLGSFLLSGLLQCPAVQRVFAFNRPSSTKSIAERQKSAFADRGLAFDLLDSDKLAYIEADASLDKCGLSLLQYEEIRNSVTLIIHNAWRLDFDLVMGSFEASIRASRNLVVLGLESPQKENLRFLFTSSVGSAQSWDKSNGPFSEHIQLDPAVAVGAGYGECKYVTERIIVKSGLHATSLRIGQIVGGAGGSWATTDWFPIIVKSSIALGVLPEAAGVVSWLREEELAAAILETAFAKEAPPPALNLVNPRSALWADIIAFVRRAIIKRKGGMAGGNDVLPIVPFEDWFTLLETKAENPSEDDLAKIVAPAIKLLEFFRAFARGDQAIRALASVSGESGTHHDGATTTMEAGMANFSTTEAQRVSSTVTNMQAIGEVEADAWVRYWISKGAF